MSYSKFYCIEVSTSVLCQRVVIVSFGLLHASMFFVTLEWFPRWQVGAAIFAMNFLIVCVVFFCRPQANFRLFLSQQGEVKYSGQLMFDGHVLTTSIEDKWFVYLKVERADVGSRISLLIWRDSVSTEAYCRLRRIIRLRQRHTV